MYRYVEEWPSYNCWEDVAILLQITFHCKSTGHIDELLYFYYRNDEGISVSIKDKEDLLLESLIANVKIPMDHIRKAGGMRYYRREFLHRKCIIKVRFWNLPWKKYVSLFPEVNVPFLFDPYMPIRNKMGHLSKCLGIHGISKFWRVKS